MKTYYILLILALQSCASHKLIINSDVPSRIEAQGVTVCESTPCAIVNSCTRHGERTRLEAFPLDKTKGYNQQKTVSANCHMGSDNATNVYFEMGARPGVAIESSTAIKTRNSDNIEKDLKFLKKMYDEGNITEKVYKEMVQKALEQ